MVIHVTGFFFSYWCWIAITENEENRLDDVDVWLMKSWIVAWFFFHVWCNFKHFFSNLCSWISKYVGRVQSKEICNKYYIAINGIGEIVFHYAKTIVSAVYVQVGCKRYTYALLWSKAMLSNPKSALINHIGKQIFKLYKLHIFSISDGALL